MPRVKLDADEWYPVYTAFESSPDSPGAFDVDEDRFNWWKRALEDFEAAQEDMRLAKEEARRGV